MLAPDLRSITHNAPLLFEASDGFAELSDELLCALGESSGID